MTDNVAIGPVLNQANPLLRPGGPGSINDCWVISGEQSAASVGGDYTGPGHVNLKAGIVGHVPTIPTFRKAAGRPDVPGIAGAGTVSDILKAVKKLYPKLVVSLSSENPKTFSAALDQGKVASLYVDSSKLPKTYRYGFGEPGVVKGHQVTVHKSGKVIYIANPLQKEGSKSRAISLKDLLKAAGTSIHAVLLAPPDAPVVNVPAPIDPPVPAGPPVGSVTQAQANADATAAYERGKVDGAITERARLRAFIGN